MPFHTDNDRVAKVLLVDDEPQVRHALARLLASHGWLVEEAASGSAALDRIPSFAPELMLLDVRMPGMSGIDVVSTATSLDPELGILMVTAVTDVSTATVCMQRGATDYLTKPIELTTLEAALRRALRRRDTMVDSRAETGWLQRTVKKSTLQLERERAKIHELSVATLETLINTLEAKSPFLSGHSARVATFGATVASEMGLNDDEVERIRLAGRLHDLGMIGVRESVLNKDGTLTDEEYEHVKRHVSIGAEILAPLKYLGDVVSYVRTHHEHWGGGGYPDGIAGEEIPLGGRVLCVSEIYDALTTKRPYQEPLAPEAAVHQMRRLEGRVIDPSVMEAVAQSITDSRSLVFLEDGAPPVQEEPKLFG